MLSGFSLMVLFDFLEKIVLVIQSSKGLRGCCPKSGFKLSGNNYFTFLILTFLYVFSIPCL